MSWGIALSGLLSYGVPKWSFSARDEASTGTQKTLLDPHFPTEHQRIPTAPTQIPPALSHQAVALR